MKKTFSLFEFDFFRVQLKFAFRIRPKALLDCSEKFQFLIHFERVELVWAKM